MEPAAKVGFPFVINFLPSAANFGGEFFEAIRANKTVRAIFFD
jgi:hypothetical protein